VVLPIQLLRLHGASYRPVPAMDARRCPGIPGGANINTHRTKRWLPLVKSLLAFPHYILVALIGSGIAGHSARSPIPDRREPGLWIECLAEGGLGRVIQATKEQIGLSWSQDARSTVGFRCSPRTSDAALPGLFREQPDQDEAPARDAISGSAGTSGP
jgi:hypothetical protein